MGFLGLSWQDSVRAAYACPTSAGLLKGKYCSEFNQRRQVKAQSINSFLCSNLLQVQRGKTKTNKKDVPHPTLQKN
jgi:hypothetical protein